MKFDMEFLDCLKKLIKQAKNLLAEPIDEFPETMDRVFAVLENTSIKFSKLNYVYLNL